MDVEAVRKGLEAELASLGVHVGPGEYDVYVTLSENAEGYVWAAEIDRNDKPGSAQKVSIMSVPKLTAESANENKESLTLSWELVWQQPKEILDFAIFDRPAGIEYSTLVILEADRLRYYQSQNGGWHPGATLAFPRSAPRWRDPSGEIWVQRKRVLVNGVQCTGDIEDPRKIECELWDDVTIGRRWIGPTFPGHEGDAGGVLSDRCGVKMVGLVSGNGDWTQPDSIQGLLLADNDADAIPSGRPINFDGPVTVVRANDKGSLRVIVHNLKSGNYEGYIVTATCSQ